MKPQRNARKVAAAGALLLAGVGVGAAVAVTSGASAESGTPTSSTSPSADAEGDHHGSGHASETPLTGTTADKVTAAVEAAYPAATIDRVETDSDGVYEAHITTADGRDLVVAVDKDFAITGTSTHTGHHGHGDHAGGNNETPLTGTTLAKVTAAVKAKYPAATIDRAETDSDGVYEAHITTADGEDLVVELGKDFAITGTHARGGHHGHGHHGGPDGLHPRGDDSPAPSTSPSASPTPS